MNFISLMLPGLLFLNYVIYSECLKTEVSTTAQDEILLSQNFTVSNGTDPPNSSLHVAPQIKTEKTGFFQNLAIKVCSLKDQISQTVNEYFSEKVLPFFERIFAPKFVVSIYETRSVINGNSTQASNQNERIAQNADDTNAVVSLNQFPHKTQPREIIDLVEREMRRKPHGKPKQQSSDIEKKQPTGIIVILKRIVKAVIRAMKSLIESVLVKSVRLAIDTDDDGPHTTIAFNMKLFGTALHFTVNGGEKA